MAALNRAAAGGGTVLRGLPSPSHCLISASVTCSLLLLWYQAAHVLCVRLIDLSFVIELATSMRLLDDWALLLEVTEY